MALLILYNDLVARIEAIVGTDGDKVFHKVAYWNSQVLETNEARETPFNYPAVFIEYPEINWSPRLDGGGFQTDVTEEQRGELSEVKLHICHSYLENPEDSFPTMHANNQLVYFAVQSMEESEDYGRLKRIREIPEHNHDRIHDWQMDFQYTPDQTGQVLNKTTIEANTLNTLIVP